ncbi:hypothetical protein I6N95_02320 [Vagococcus sp. BWB3-3]|uniref:Competence protein CoiA n=1 Tax=Vagococcus allomyrinae TaxID=2794353 RepID=A0A940SQL3_9ENTE|nr:competence protein CoiA family protein [Vagococcus allomyrinae]MBP1039837.1 hypothetical protein [Vagococcus allomyrinae]
MYIGHNDHGERVNLMGRSKQDISKLTNQRWWCQSCGMPLSIKNGLVKQSHFAHRKDSACQNFSEGETEEHLEGKRILAQWCDKFQLQYQLEAYLPELNQRPDLLLAGEIAIEFQCSPLSLPRFIERTENYQRHGYRVVWVLGKHFFVGKRLTAFQRSCLAYQQQIGFYLWELDVDKERLACLLHMEEVLGNERPFYSRKVWEKGSISLLSVFKFPQHSKLFIRREYDQQAILLSYFDKIERGLVRRDRQILSIQDLLYQQGHHLRGLDTCFFLPITQPLFGKEAVLMWRLLVWETLKKSPKTTFSDLFQDFYLSFKQSQSSYFVMPMVPLERNLRLFLGDYLAVLSHYDYLVYQEGYFCLRQLPQVFMSGQERSREVRHRLANSNHISAIPRQNMLS